MSVILSRFLYLFSEAFCLYCLYVFYGTFLSMKKICNGKRNIIYGLSFLLYVMPNLLWHEPALNLLASVLAFIIYMGVFEGKNAYRVVLIIFAIAISLLTERLIRIWVTIIGIDSNPSILGVASDVYEMVISRLVFYVIIKSINLAYRRKEKYYIDTYQWWIVLLIPLLSIGVIYQAYRWSMRFQISGQDMIPYLSIIIMIFCIDVLVFYLYEKLLAKYKESIELEQIRMQNRYYMNYNHIMSENQKKLRSWKHDMKNYLVGILVTLTKGDIKTAFDMLHNRINGFTEIKELYHSGNIAIDTILNYKLQEANEKNIVVNCDIVVPDNLPIDSGDFAIILGNSIDNAIEACEQLLDEDKRISIMMDYHSGMLLYIIKNRYKRVEKIKGKFISTKKDQREHGIGLHSIETILKKYGGRMEIEAGDKMFTLKIYMFI